VSSDVLALKSIPVAVFDGYPVFENVGLPAASMVKDCISIPDMYNFPLMLLIGIPVPVGFLSTKLVIAPGDDVGATAVVAAKVVSFERSMVLSPIRCNLT